MKTNPWAFAIVFLSVILFWMYHNFELPKFYPFEKTATTRGVIYQADRVRPNLPRGVRYDQAIYYIYKVNDSIYISEAQFNKRQGFSIIGDSLLIEYSKREPSRSKVLHNLKIPPLDLYNDHFKTHFSCVKENGFKELTLNANIFTYADYANYGKLTLKVSGTFTNIEDTLTLNPFVHHKFDKAKYKSEDLIPINTKKIKLSKFYANSDATITEISTGLVLK